MAKKKKNEAESFKKLKTEKIILSNKDFDRLVEELNNPKPPNEALKKARKAYLELKKEKKND